MKIPDDVFENRCRYCFHGRPDAGNKDIFPEWLWSVFHRKDLSCGIFGISRCDEIPGECISFSPNYIFGICLTCQHNNSFSPDYCMKAKQPNKRKVFIGNGGLGGAAHPDYWMEHVLSTCDAYAVSADWIDIMQKQAAEGKILRNFDPETMKAIGPAMRNETAEKWAVIDRRRQEAVDMARLEAEKKRSAEEEIQLSLFD